MSTLEFLWLWKINESKPQNTIFYRPRKSTELKNNVIKVTSYDKWSCKRQPYTHTDTHNTHISSIPTKYQSLAIGRMRKLALLRELHGEIWINPKWRQHIGVFIVAKASHVRMREGRAASCSGLAWVWRCHRWLARHQTSSWHIAYGLSIGGYGCHQYSQSEELVLEIHHISNLGKLFCEVMEVGGCLWVCCLCRERMLGSPWMGVCHFVLIDSWMHSFRFAVLSRDLQLWSGLFSFNLYVVFGCTWWQSQRIIW